ncbi:MAG: glycosyltransferase family 1 protein [Candidatus Microthrix sp.]|jgi:MGT family glycosyltransferase|uniref:glycosyltransferase n=1 Tax=Candidatus Neomicrothrix sp. TaxID=2719034 RepID=UPI001B71385E|nr:glycosyltransferase [Candidatus Microthrix sp.]MBP7406204.1 glycosyltransferase family 1 protein [Candidatus Microthrix sp.]MBP7854214.1 glycosyltransferase family 1 protein [Candidatus Microthrix sp.]MBP8958681.1 glycosyltransferase family 1 protein [Candidatus Microthrix sp.]
MRVLFVVPPLTGHTNPTVAVGAELITRGHEVAWCGDPGHLAAHLPAGSTIIPAADDLPTDLVQAITERAQGLRGAAALKFLWEDFLEPLARATLPGVSEAVEAYDPDVLVVDQQAVAGAIVGRRTGRLWVTSATTSADLIDPFAALPKLRHWVDERLVDLQVSVGIPAAEADPVHLRFSPHLVLAFTTEALMGTVPDVGAPLACVGPAFAHRPAPAGGSHEFNWRWLDGRPLVLVSLGTVSAGSGTRFLTAAAEALGARPHLQGVVVGEINPEAWSTGNAPADNVMVVPRVPQVELLERCDAVVSHGGHNTVCETLANGLPLVVAPIRDDQPIVADQVEQAGAGIRVRYARTGAAQLGDALDTILAEPSYREAAQRLQRSFTEAGGASAAAQRLEALL